MAVFWIAQLAPFVVWIIMIAVVVRIIIRAVQSGRNQSAQRYTPPQNLPKNNLPQNDLPQNKQPVQAGVKTFRTQKGGASEGVRLYEGDSVPAGMRPVKCSYCGADNLIPVNAGGKYTCYFCREEL